MKVAIFFAVVCCLSVAFACEKNEDCDDGQCCIQISPFSDKVCKNYRKKDDFCFPNDAWNKASDYYKFMCPCIDGFTCEPESVEQDGDITRYINSRCVEKTAF